MTDKRGRPVLTREWLDERLELFERYCLPSVAYQTEQRFVWLVLLDEATDAETVRRLEGHRTKVKQLALVYLPIVRNRATLARPVVERAGPEPGLLVTTRLDNDDALHEEALAEIRRHAVDRQGFLNLRLGFVTDGVRAQPVSLRHGPFLSLVEPRGPGRVRTVHGSPHTQVARIAPVRQIESQPLWLRVVHGRNVRNVAFEEQTARDIRSPRRLASRLRSRVVAAIQHPGGRGRPAATMPLDEIAAEFHIGEALPAATRR